MASTNEHLDDLKRALTKVLSPLMAIDAIHETPTTRTGAPVNLGPRVGPDTVPVSIKGYGWGTGFQRRRVHLLTGYDPTQTIEVSTADALDLLAEVIERDTEIVQAAHDAGLAEPLHGDALESTAHLLADRDAIAAIAAWAGSPDAARKWVQNGLKRRREHLEATPSRTDRSTMRILLDRLHVTYDLVAECPTDQRVDDGEGYLWAGPIVRVVHALPDTVKTACIGRPLGDVLAETPVGHRIVTGVEADVTDDGASLMMLEPAWKRLDDLLPPMPRGSAPL